MKIAWPDPCSAVALLLLDDGNVADDEIAQPVVNGQRPAGMLLRIARQLAQRDLAPPEIDLRVGVKLQRRVLAAAAAAHRDAPCEVCGQDHRIRRGLHRALDGRRRWPLRSGATAWP